MTTSGVTALSLTARTIIETALREINAIPVGQDADAAEVEPIITTLNMMIKGWETSGPHLWRVTEGSVAVTPVTMSYSLSADNPIRLKEVRFRYADGHDLPMKKLSRTKYVTLPNKNSQGVSTQWYFDPQEASQSLYVWPILATSTTERLVYTYQRRFQICTSLNDTLDIPNEWHDTVMYCLAERLLPRYGQETASAQRIERRAQMLLRQAKAFDRPDCLYMMPEKRFST